MVRPRSVWHKVSYVILPVWRQAHVTSISLQPTSQAVSHHPQAVSHHPRRRIHQYDAESKAISVYKASKLKTASTKPRSEELGSELGLCPLAHACRIQRRLGHREPPERGPTRSGIRRGADDKLTSLCRSRVGAGASGGSAIRIETAARPNSRGHCRHQARPSRMALRQSPPPGLAGLPDQLPRARCHPWRSRSHPPLCQLSGPLQHDASSIRKILEPVARPARPQGHAELKHASTTPAALRYLWQEQRAAGAHEDGALGPRGG